MDTGSHTRTLEGHTNPVATVAMTRNGRFAISASSDDIWKVCDLKGGSELRTFSGQTHPVHGVAISDDGRRILSASGDGMLKLWDSECGREVAIFTCYDSAACCAFVGKITIIAGDAARRTYFLRLKE